MHPFIAFEVTFGNGVLHRLLGGFFSGETRLEDGFGEEGGQRVPCEFGAFVSVATVAIEYSEEDVCGARGEGGCDDVGVLVGFVGFWMRDRGEAEGEVTTFENQNIHCRDSERFECLNAPSG